MKRILTGAISLLAVLTLVTACGNDGSDGSSNAGSSNAGSSADSGSSAGGAAMPSDPAQICDAAGLVEAVQGGPTEGTLAGMTDDPVATAASNNPVLTTLVTAVGQAGLGDTLNAAPELTVFAPTDCAFAQFDQATLQAALADPQGLLTQVLAFHVIPERLSPDELTARPELTTLSGATLDVAADGEVISLNGGQATIVVPDIQTANATVYLIDAVMVP